MKWYYSDDMIMTFLKRNPQYRICTLQFYIKYYKSVIFDDTGWQQLIGSISLVFISRREARYHIFVRSYERSQRRVRFQLATSWYMNDWACQYSINSVS